MKLKWKRAGCRQWCFGQLSIHQTRDAFRAGAGWAYDIYIGDEWFAWELTMHKAKGRCQRLVERVLESVQAQEDAALKAVRGRQ